MNKIFNDYGIVNDINLTISSFAYETILEDIKNFIYKVDRSNFSKFCSKVFVNYYQEASSNFEVRRINELKNLKSYINEKKNYKDKEKILDFLNGYLDSKFKSELKSNKYKKDKSKKIYLDNEVIDILIANYESIREYYPSHITFFSSVLEEYTRLPFYKREMIYFKEIIDTINLSKNKLNVDLILYSKDANNNYSFNKLYFKPYDVVRDKIDTFNYVVGYSKKANDTTFKRYEIKSFRISRIKEIRVNDTTFSFDKEELKRLKEELTKKDVRFLSGNELEFKVKFTNKGMTLLNQILYMKPSSYIKDEHEKNVYYFYCSERQLEIYLKEFGSEAIVISPSTLKNKLKIYYDNASLAYKEK